MTEHTAIEWCDHTFNPWIGCTKVGPGCDHCYAENLAARWNMAEWGVGKPRKRTGNGSWNQPRKWQRRAEAFDREHNRRQRVFCASMADVFDNAASPMWRAELLALIEDTPDLDWLLLTKRVGNVEGMLRDLGYRFLPENVWLGATVVNQAEADRDVRKLLSIGVTAWFLSIEPMLGPITLDPYWLRPPEPVVKPFRGIREPTLDWIICGGESGQGARPMHPDWARSLRDQCNATQTPFLFKQWGDWVPADHAAGLGVDLTKAAATAWHGSDLLSYRVGKKWAGRKLDGITHTMFPRPV